MGNNYENLDIAIDFGGERGSLHKFNGINSVDLVNENYLNIGQLTWESLQIILQKVQNIQSVTTLLLEYPLDQANTSAVFKFYQQTKSCGLIYAERLQRVRILGNSTFTNIYQNDRNYKMTSGTGLYDLFSYGLIMTLFSFNGDVQIGGNFEILGSGNSLTQFSNFTGLFNNFTSAKFRNWNPNNWLNANSSNIEYGVGSPLFNFLDFSNSFSSIVFQNSNFKRIYSRANLTRSLSLFPMIMSNNFDTTDIPTPSYPSFSIKNCAFSQITYERGWPYFFLKGKNISITNTKFKDIGYNFLIEDPLWRGLSSMFQNLETINKAPLFIINYDFGSQITNGMPAVIQSTNISNTQIINFASQLNSTPVMQINVLKNIGNQQNLVNFNNCTFIGNNKTESFNSPILSELSTIITPMNISFSGCNFINQSSQSGPFTVLQHLQSLSFDNCYFENQRGVVVDLFYLRDSIIKSFSLSNSMITQKYSSDNLETAIMNKDLSAFKNPSLIYSQNQRNLVFNNITVQYQNFANSGAFLNNANTSAIIRNSKFSYLSAAQGGAISSSFQSNITIEDSDFESIYSIEAGVFFVYDSTFIHLKSSQFLFNYALNQGVFKFFDEVAFIIEDCLFFKNIAALQNSIGQIIQMSTISTITNTKFIMNKAYQENTMASGKGLEILACDGTIAFIASTFKDNYAQYFTPNILMYSANLITFEDCMFQNSKQKNKDFNKIQGNYLSIMANSNVTIKNSKFIYGSAYSGGAIYISGSSSLYIESSTFQQNYAFNNGGAIAGDSFYNLFISKGTQFNLNDGAISLGDAIYASNPSQTIQISESTHFISNKSTNFIYFQYSRNLIIDNSKFELDQKVNLANPLIESAVYLEQSKVVLITNTVFSNLIGNSTNGGAALYLKESLNNKDKKKNITISDCSFQDSFNINGGAVGLQDMSNVTIQRSQFINNKADFQGGAIYFYCSDIMIMKDQCNLNIRSSLFYNNSASEGGALKWNKFEPEHETLELYDNTAKRYGDNIAAIATYLVRISENQTNVKTFQIDQKYGRRFLYTKNQTSTVELEQIANFGPITDAQSGGKLNFTFALLDQYGNVVRTDNKSTLYITPIQQSGQLQTVLESESRIKCVNGIFNVSPLSIVGQPNTNQRLNISTDGITNIENSQPFLILDILLRRCLAGEELRPNGQCQVCEEGFYMLTAPNKTQLCSECLIKDKAECLGSNLVYPKAGFWRTSIERDNFFKCRNNEACIGRNPPEDNMLGACQTGYQGILCAECQIGYSRTGTEYKCSKCPAENINALRLFGIVLLVLFCMMLLIRSTMAKTSSKKNNMPVFIRILMNHLQLLFLTASFELEWPQILQNYFTIMKPVTEYATLFVSIDCFLDKRDAFTFEIEKSFTVEQISRRVFFQKLIILALSPFGFLSISVILWAIVYKFRKSRNQMMISILPNNSKQEKIENASNASIDLRNQKNEMKANVIESLIVIMFIIHPTITNYMFSAFNCTNMDDQMRLYEDLEVICYQHSHSLIAFIVALPGLLIWGIGIPAVGLVLIIKNRQKLYEPDIYQKYGFLFKGYRQQRAYYWEFVIIFRKITLIFIQVFLAQTGKIVQALSTLLFLILSLSSTAVIRPFQTLFLNNLESVSLLSSAITVYCSIFYIANAYFKNQTDFHLSPQADAFLFSMIVLCHGVFAVSWIFYFIQELRLTIRNKLQKLYVAIFLCCNERKLEKEIHLESNLAILEQFLVSLEKISDYIHDTKKQYASGKVPMEDEEFKRCIYNANNLALQQEMNFKKTKVKNFWRLEDLIESKISSKSPKALRLNKKKKHRVKFGSFEGSVIEEESVSSSSTPKVFNNSQISDKKAKKGELSDHTYSKESARSSKSPFTMPKENKTKASQFKKLYTKNKAKGTPSMTSTSKRLNEIKQDFSCYVESNQQKFATKLKQNQQQLDEEESKDFVPEMCTEDEEVKQSGKEEVVSEQNHIQFHPIDDNSLLDSTFNLNESMNEILEMKSKHGDNNDQDMFRIKRNPRIQKKKKKDLLFNQSIKEE